jgi:hypothetical protein
MGCGFVVSRSTSMAMTRSLQRHVDHTALELLRDRSGGDVESNVVDPIVLLDVDADGELEVIEAGTSYRLTSFDRDKSYATLPVDHCT